MLLANSVQGKKESRILIRINRAKLTSIKLMSTNTIDTKLAFNEGDRLLTGFHTLDRSLSDMTPFCLSFPKYHCDAASSS